MLRAGRLDQLLTFLARPVVDGAGGSRRGPLEFQFKAWADVRLRSGSESFTAARIEGRVPAEVRVRDTPETRRIGTGWIVRDERGVDWNVQAPAPDPQNRDALMFMMIAGGAPG